MSWINSMLTLGLMLILVNLLFAQSPQYKTVRAGDTLIVQEDYKLMNITQYKMLIIDMKDYSTCKKQLKHYKDIDSSWVKIVELKNQNLARKNSLITLYSDEYFKLHKLLLKKEISSSGLLKFGLGAICGVAIVYLSLEVLNNTK